MRGRLGSPIRAGAGSTDSSALRMSCVGFVEGMPTKAVCLGSVVASRVGSSVLPLTTRVLRSRDNLQMCGVAAGRVAARVVECEAVGYWSDERSVDNPVGSVGSDSPAQLDDSVASLVGGSLEDPASGGGRDRASKDSVVCRRGWYWHASHYVSTIGRQYKEVST
jgi:hypothetical protein